MSFSQVSATYSRRERLRIRTVPVVHPGLRAWALGVRRFCNGVPEELRQHPLWRETVIRLRFISSELCSTPLPFCVLGETHRAGLETLTETAAGARTGFPQLVEDALPLIERAIRFSEGHDNPLLESAIEAGVLEHDDGPVALLLARGKRLEAVGAELDELGANSVIPCVSPDTLGESAALARVLCIGPANAFSESVLFAPAADEVVFLGFDFFAPLRSPRSLSPRRRTGVDRWDSVGLSVPSGVASPGEVPEEATGPEQPLEANFVVPNLDWRIFIKSVVEPAEDDSSGEGTPLVEARPILLSGGFVVLMGGHEGAKASTVQFNGGVAEVHAQRVGGLEPGTYLLVRTEGGGDLVLELSWRLLGKQRDEIETAQLTWKVALLEEIRLRGVSQAAEWLNQEGVASANEATLRYWVSADSIQPGSEADFHRLMQVLGLGQHATSTWAMGRAIRAARLKAAWRIRRRLLKEVARTSESDFAAGRLEFSLGEGGTLAAWRVIEVAPETTLVNPSRIGLPESVEEQLWLG